MGKRRNMSATVPVQEVWEQLVQMGHKPRGVAWSSDADPAMLWIDLNQPSLCASPGGLHVFIVDNEPVIREEDWLEFQATCMKTPCLPRMERVDAPQPPKITPPGPPPVAGWAAAPVAQRRYSILESMKAAAAKGAEGVITRNPADGAYGLAVSVPGYDAWRRPVLHHLGTIPLPGLEEGPVVDASALDALLGQLPSA